MKQFLKVFSVAALFAFAGYVVAESEISVEGIKCIVSGAAVKADKHADYAEGKVFFCCENCAKKFEDDKDKFATKANHQLVATKQYEQNACPLSGGDLNKDTAIEVNGVKVKFCCNNCKGKVDKMKDDEKVEAVFSKDAFEKAKFAKVEEKKDDVK